eukprot:1177861-Prymnesium_polylepis.2
MTFRTELGDRRRSGADEASGAVAGAPRPRLCAHALVGADRAGATGIRVVPVDDRLVVREHVDGHTQVDVIDPVALRRRQLVGQGGVGGCAVNAVAGGGRVALEQCAVSQGDGRVSVNADRAARLARPVVQKGAPEEEGVATKNEDGSAVLRDILGKGAVTRVQVARVDADCAARRRFG